MRRNLLASCMLALSFGVVGCDDPAKKPETAPVAAPIEAGKPAEGAPADASKPAEGPGMTGPAPTTTAPAPTPAEAPK